jgi:dTDP-4-amino-4,6-dideoxygalactose transaminase
MIPLLRPLVPSDKAARRIFAESRRAGVYSNFGPNYDALARQFESDGYGSHVVLVSTGTAAIEVALRVSGLVRGARVGLPDFTHVGTLLAVHRAGMVPVLFGVDPQTWTLRPGEVQKAFADELIDAVVVVAPFGYDCHVEAWEQISYSDGLPVVFDFAGAFGYALQVRSPVCYSFHATKNLGVGEGGMIAFSDPDQAAAARRLSNFDTLPDRSIASLDGTNYKLPEIVCAYLAAQLETRQYRRLVERIDRKRALLRFYEESLPHVYVPPGPKFPSLCVLGNLPAQDLEEASEAMGVTFKRYYPLLSRMSALDGVDRVSVSGDEMVRCVAVPCDVDIVEAFVVVDRIQEHQDF